MSGAGFIAPAEIPDATSSRDGLLVELERIGNLVSEREPECSASIRTSPELALLCRRLGLTAFEGDLLMLAAAVELDGGIATAVSKAQGGPVAPTFALALAILPDPHWDALSPERPLRRRRLVHIGQGDTFASRPLRIDEAVLHRLSGLPSGSLDGLLDTPQAAGTLTPSQRAVANEIAAAVQAIDGLVIVRLDGPDPSARAAVTAHIAHRLGGEVLAVRDAAVDRGDVVEVAAVLDRESLLDERLVTTGHSGLIRLLESEVLVTDTAVDAPGRISIARTIELPSAAEQVTLWHDALGDRAGGMETTARELAYHFQLSARAIAAIAAEWSTRADADSGLLRRLTRERARVGFGALARRIEPRATWDDLVLPAGQRELLGDIERQVRHRATVYDEWGFATTGNNGLGVSALFAGESGTGKTMAAEVISGSLGLDLYRVDLAATVSKYIGETEKNLGSVFDAAESAGAVLLFDEADALFGKRSEVKDSHDRYANLEVAYLLQRMEAYRGLAILTTNLRANVDRAFLRRIRFVVQFPFPDERARAGIWRRVFPSGVPLQDFSPEALASMQLSGGAIRSIALSAAFAAADAQTPVTAEHLLRAARLEAAKAERRLTDSETAALRKGGAQ